MINYMLAFKTVPYPAPEWLKTLQLNEIPMSLRPAETNCHDCQNTLSGPYRITQRAKIFYLCRDILKEWNRILSYAMNVTISIGTKNTPMGYIISMMFSCLALMFASFYAIL